ncbi:MAG: LacI family DNA-binding transcriptional regulator, partial [Firmicutes bacterium]|nr:LacI family DNA-binding transcriptional regulator [Candidatus Onthovivens merdipullorum]
MQVTIKDIAKYCGVSTATVSRVLNSPNEVKEETRNKILNAIKKFKFVPNKKAQNLAHNASNTIAFVTSFESNGAFLNPHKFEIMSGAQKVLEEAGYFVLLLQVSNNIKNVKLLYENKSVSGFIIHSSS